MNLKMVCLLTVLSEEACYSVINVSILCDQGFLRFPEVH